MKSTKSFYLVFLLLNMAISVFSQAPNSFKYQALLKNNDGTVISNQIVGMRISIIQGETQGQAVYTETFKISTDPYGLINLNIGMGESADSISNIEWGLGPYFIKIELDATGGENYELFSVSQLLSVPYALYANKANYANSAFTPSYPSGTNKIIPITWDFSDGTFTVPPGKILYILNIYSTSTTEGWGTLGIDGHPVARGRFTNSIDNNTISDVALILAQPFIAADHVSGTNMTINGYLVDN